MQTTHGRGALLDPTLLKDVLHVHQLRRGQELRQQRAAQQRVQVVVRGEPRDAARDAHERARAQLAVLLHRVRRHARPVLVGEQQELVHHWGGAPGLQEDVRLFGGGHRLCGDGEEHVRVLVREPVLEWEGLGRGADDAEGLVGYREVG